MECPKSKARKVGDPHNNQHDQHTYKQNIPKTSKKLLLNIDITLVRWIALRLKKWNIHKLFGACVIYTFKCGFGLVACCIVHVDSLHFVSVWYVIVSWPQWGSSWTYFLVVSDAGGPRGKPHSHRENMQSPHSKTQSCPGIEPGTSHVHVCEPLTNDGNDLTIVF